MKQHILEHWIKLAQEIQEGLDKEVKDHFKIKNDWVVLTNTKDSCDDLISYLDDLKWHFKALNT
jgi:HJR/Mrr/RecB family endonuclease